MTAVSTNVFFSEPRNASGERTPPTPVSSGGAIVTTSWDDGDRNDLRVAELLKARGLAGTFYIPIHPDRSDPTLGHAELRSLVADGFEIGGHGLSHRSLPDLARGELRREVQDSKRILEDVLGSPVRMFCYPRGRYNREAIRALREAGYEGARTTRMLRFDGAFERFEMPVSLQCYPHTRTAYLKNIAKAGSIALLPGYFRRFGQLRNWVDLGKSIFDQVLQVGGIWHLYGHSWEIDEFGLWGELTRMLDYVYGREEVRYLSNGSVLSDNPGNRVGSNSPEGKRVV